MKAKQNKYSRRDFIGKYFYASTVLVSGAVLLGCNSMKTVAGETANEVPSEGVKPVEDTVKTSPAPIKSPEQPVVQKIDPCDDLSGVSAEEIEKRKKLAYVNKTPIPDSHCSNCTLYLPAAKDKPCGGCLLFKGPVRKEGYCAYWAPISG